MEIRQLTIKLSTCVDTNALKSGNKKASFKIVLIGGEFLPICS